jgi:hypothetical protein
LDRTDIFEKEWEVAGKPVALDLQLLAQPAVRAQRAKRKRKHGWRQERSRSGL